MQHFNFNSKSKSKSNFKISFKFFIAIVLFLQAIFLQTPSVFAQASRASVPAPKEFQASSLSAPAPKVVQAPKVAQTPKVLAQETSFPIQQDNANHANSKIIETHDISEILPHLDRNTLVVFAIDYTLFWSKTRLGSPEWSRHLIQSEINKGSSREDSFKKHYPAWIKAQQFSEVALLDERLPKLMKDLKHKCLGYIALTARHGTSAEVTRWQLHKFDIDFLRSNFANCHYHSKFKYPAIFRDGILYAHTFNEKGQIFWEWMTQAMPQFRRLRSLHKVVCIEDNMQNLLSIQKAAESLNLEFLGIRYSAGDGFKKPVSGTLVENERQILMTNYSDSEARLLLESIGSYGE